MKTSELLAKVEMLPVPKAKNLRAVGWADGYMVVQFWSSPQRWIYGPKIAEAELGKILRVPYPDALFQNNIKKRVRDAGDHQAAADALQATVAIAPDFGRLPPEIGNFRGETGELRAALQALDRFLALADDDDKRGAISLRRNLMTRIN